MYTNTMHAGDAISGKMAKCLITIEGRRLDFMVAIALGLSACSNTVRGVGTDLEKAGQEIQKTAR